MIFILFYRSECIAYNNSARKYRETMNFFFCCCNEDFCNDKMFIIPGEDEEPGCYRLCVYSTLEYRPYQFLELTEWQSCIFVNKL